MCREPDVRCVTATAQTLVERLKSRVGDDLRSVARYDESGYELVYLRDDVAEQYDDERLDDIFENLRMEAILMTDDEQRYDHGPLDCVIRSFDRAVEMHFALSRSEGVAISLDAGAMMRARSFTGELLRVVRDDH